MEGTRKKLQRGVVVEFDFAQQNGAELLYEAARRALVSRGVQLTTKLEALHLAGGNYQGGLEELFMACGKDADPYDAAQTIAHAFRAALNSHISEAMTDDFKKFLKVLTDNGLKIIISSRMPLDKIDRYINALNLPMVITYNEPSVTYGNCKWDAWQRACSMNSLHEEVTVAVTGSGCGVKSALIAGMPVIAVERAHVRYQDFGGADAVVQKLDAEAAGEILRILKIKE